MSSSVNTGSYVNFFAGTDPLGSAFPSGPVAAAPSIGTKSKYRFFPVMLRTISSDSVPRIFRRPL